MSAPWMSGCLVRRLLGLAVISLLLGVGVVASAHLTRMHSTLTSQREDAESEKVEGRVEREPVPDRPMVAAAFAAESYRPGRVADLVLFDSGQRVKLRLFRVSDARGVLHDGGVLAPNHLGEHRIAVVLPTQTWQAYNYRDDDGDGIPNTWYYSASIHTARLYRPFENRGVPPHYHYYDEPFLRWVAHEGYGVDYLSDAELKTTSGGALARAYDLLIFSGHHEYVTSHEYDAVVRYRDLGGNLISLRKQLLLQDHDCGKPHDARRKVA